MGKCVEKVVEFVRWGGLFTKLLRKGWALLKWAWFGKEFIEEVGF